MKKFLKITILFLLPVIGLIVFVLADYKYKQGDLARMSYLKVDYDYSTVFKDENSLKHIVIENDTSSITKKKWKFFTIGDSFFQQKKFGFVNYLSHQYPGNVINFNNDYLIEDNIMLTFQGLINSDYFDSVDVDYVIFENVERYVIYRSLIHRTDVNYTFSAVQQKIEEVEDERNEYIKSKKNEPYPTDRFIKFPLNNLVYAFNTTGINGDVYREPLTQSMFSTKANELLFFKEDVSILEANNSKENADKLNQILNEMSRALSAKGIQLIVMIYPDKFDIYNPYLVNRDAYPKPIFYPNFDALEKEYSYFDVNSLFKKELANGTKDLYLFDDTHTSPIASKIMLHHFLEEEK